MKKFIVLALALLAPSISHGGTLANTNAAEFGLNTASQNQMQKFRLGTAIQKNRIHVLKGIYNFSTQGGASSTTYPLKMADGQPLILPNKSIIRNCVIDVLTAFTAGTSTTIALTSGQTASDIKIQLGATATYGSTGLVACIPVGTAATSIKLTADRNASIVIGTPAPLTAGKMNVLFEFELSE